MFTRLWYATKKWRSIYIIVLRWTSKLDPIAEVGISQVRLEKHLTCPIRVKVQIFFLLHSNNLELYLLGSDQKVKFWIIHGSNLYKTTFSRVRLSIRAFHWRLKMNNRFNQCNMCVTNKYYFNRLSIQLNSNSIDFHLPSIILNRYILLLQWFMCNRLW